MRKLQIEHKRPQNHPRQDTTISLLEASLRQQEHASREMLKSLEKALVRCGYTSDYAYNSRTLRCWEGSHILLYWKGGKILLGQGSTKKREEGKKPSYTRNEPLPVKNMSGRDLLRVASHLVPFVDALESSVRHQIRALQDAMATIQSLIDRVEEDPQPSDTPAQVTVE